MSEFQSHNSKAILNMASGSAPDVVGSQALKHRVFGPALRAGTIVPLAGGLTFLLLLTMANLVATEFKPQDKFSETSYEINPLPVDLPPVIDVPMPDPLKQVEVPPPPPTLDHVQVASVELPIIPLVGSTKGLPRDGLDIDLDGPIVNIDGEGGPIVRIPPVFPPRFLQGNHSGYCRMRFDVSAQGKPFNVKIVTCTDRHLEAPSVKSVQKWNYKPAVRNGVGVMRPGLETTIRFYLKDERGNQLPLPSGY